MWDLRSNLYSCQNTCNRCITAHIINLMDCNNDCNTGCNKSPDHQPPLVWELLCVWLQIKVWKQLLTMCHVSLLTTQLTSKAVFTVNISQCHILSRTFDHICVCNLAHLSLSLSVLPLTRHCVGVDPAGCLSVRTYSAHYVFLIAPSLHAYI